MNSESKDATTQSGMNRRNFIQRTALGGALALAGTAAGGFGGEAPAASGAASASTAAFELEEATVAELQAGMQAGKYTARSLTEMYLARIEALDKRGPGVNAVIEINPDALALADKADDDRRRGVAHGLLHGIPVLLKDNIDTGDRMQTTAGSLALAGLPAREDSAVARRLREAGAVILGKTNLSEWANFRSTRSSSGWSGRGGQTRNPYALDRNPCGSSSGSGAAVAANFCAVAVGTETDGSIVCPSSANSIVGLKPTVGLVSRTGIVPISHTQDTAGPMARTVADAAALLGAIAGADGRDAATAGSRGASYTDYVQFLDPKGLQGARIGVARKLFVSHEKVVALVDEALEVMKKCGATIIDPADVPKTEELDKPEFEVLLYEFKADLNAYLAARGAGSPARNLEELIEYNEHSRDTEMPYFGQEIFTMAEAKGPLTDADYLKALESARRLSREEGIDALLREQHLDAIVAPTGGPPWLTDPVNGDHFLGASSTPAAVSGYPNITVPVGYVFGLPVAISLFAGAYAEPMLLKLAYAFEQATKARRVPRFLASADLGS
jgi:amidase